MRTCTRCGVDKRLGQFKRLSGRDGWRSHCRACEAAAMRLWRAAHPVRLPNKSHTALRPDMVRAVNELPYSQDDWSWYVVESHPNGLVLDEIAQLLGVSRERIRQIEEQAIAKLKRALGADVPMLLSELTRARDDRSVGKGYNVSR